MKINTVAAVLKKERTVRVFHDEKNQALTNGHALYMINDLPPITTCEQLAAIIGLTKEQAGKFNLKVENEMPPIFSCKNVEESYLEKSNLEYVFYGEKYSAFRNDSVLLFVRSNYLSPFKEFEDLYYYDRFDTERQTHSLAIEAGMFGTIGIIMPVKLEQYEFYSEFEKAYHLIKSK